MKELIGDKMKKILILSPHLDDAVLSCGDLIDKYVKKNYNVDILTIFSKNVDDSKLSDAAKIFHSNCFIRHDAMEYRKQEDKNAGMFLKCNNFYLDFKECLYRRDKKGFLYPNLNNIYHLESKREQKNLDKLIKKLKKLINDYDTVIAPLGLGNHADHLIVNYAINCLRNEIKGQLLFYEEVAYVCYYYRDNKISNWGSNMKYKLIEVCDSNFDKKINAILLYRSQLNILWNNYNQMLCDLEKLSLKYSNKRTIRLWYYENI